MPRNISRIADLFWLYSCCFNLLVSLFDRAAKEDELLELQRHCARSESDNKAFIKERQSLLLIKLGQVKQGVEIFQSSSDLGLIPGAEGIALVCGIVSALISTHKLTLKSL